MRMSTIGTLICGSSSRGMAIVIPADPQRRQQEKRRQRRTDCALCEMPHSLSSTWFTSIARFKSGEYFHASACPGRGKRARAAPDAPPRTGIFANAGIVNAKVGGDERSRNNEAGALAGRYPQIDALADEVAETRDDRIGDHAAIFDLWVN